MKAVRFMSLFVILPFVLPIIFFYLVFPLLVPYLTADELSQSSYHWENLMFYLPALCLSLGAMSSFKYGFNWQFPLLVLIFFPLIFLNYGNIWRFAISYTIFAFLGVSLGLGIRKSYKKAVVRLASLLGLCYTNY